MADQNFALYSPPSTVVNLFGLQHRQVSRTVTPFAGQGSVSVSVVHYQMIGARVSDGVWVTWSVTGTPDATGAHAPQPVVTSSITATRRWVT